MKKLMLVMVGLLFVTQSMAEPVYRPYATCISPNRNTNIELMQNVDAKNTKNPYHVTVVRDIRGNKLSLTDLNAMKVPLHRKDVLEFFQSFNNKPGYGFNLLITTKAPVNVMVGEYKAYYSDFLGVSVVHCSYHVTGL